MKKVLVTGSKGFIGKRLIKKLEKLKFEVVSFDDDYFLIDNWREELTRRLEDNQIRTIFHVGACSNTLESNVQLMFERNYESTKVISDWSNINKANLIYSSSAANYGINSNYPSNLYGWSKYVAEDYVIKNSGIALITSRR